MSQTSSATPNSSKPRIAYLGLGAMGAPMAQRLHSQGFPITAWSRNPTRTKPLADRGVTTSTSIAEAVTAADLIISCVTDDTAVLDLYLGRHAALSAARPGTTIIDMSTILPNTSRQLAAAARAKNLIPLDAPVSGSVSHASTGQLVTFVGGDAEAYTRCLPIFSTLSRAHYHMGPNGAGSTMKLLVNSILGTALQTLAEALSFGQADGLARDTILTALAETTVINPSQKAKLQNIREQKYPTTFALHLMAKDFSLINQLAAQNRTPIPTIAAAAAIYSAALQTQSPNDDYSSVIPFTEKLAGLKR